MIYERDIALRQTKIIPIRGYVAEEVNRALSDVRPEKRKEVGHLARRQFGAFMIEAGEIADQINTSRYREHVRKEQEFLGTQSQFGTCSHSKIPSYHLVSPLVTEIERWPGGVIDLTRPGLAKVENLPVVMFTGTHVNEEDPTKSCSFTVENARRAGANDESLSRDGGLTKYLKDLRGGFDAVKEEARKTGGKAVVPISTIYVEDTGEIVLGAQTVFDQEGEGMFRDRTLRQNLDRLQEEGKILRTGKLCKDRKFRNDIFATLNAANWSPPTDILDPNAIAKNLITIGSVAMRVTRNYENTKGGFDFIPKHLLTGDPDIDRTIVYEVLKNVTSILLGDISKKGQVIPETNITRIGTEGPAHQLRRRSGIITLHEREISPDALEAARYLEADIRTPAREDGPEIIFITSDIPSSTDFSHPYDEQKARAAAVRKVDADTAFVKTLMEEQIWNGEKLVLRGIFDRQTKKMVL